MFNFIKSAGLKQFAKIGKSDIRAIIAENKIFEKSVTVDKKGNCSKCPFAKYDDQGINYICTNGVCCNHQKEFVDSYVAIETKIHNSKKCEVVLNEKFNNRLSKGAIKLFLLYHFLPELKFAGKEVEGRIRKNVKFTDLANLCKMSVPAVKTNHNRLVKLGYILETNKKRNSVDIVINGEHKLHDKKSEGGTGYIQLSIDFLIHIFSFENINSLRIELNKLLSVDAKSNKKFISFNKDNLLKVLPSYIKKSLKLKDKLLNNNKTLFPVKNNSISIDRFKTYKTRYNELKSEYIIQLKKYIDEHNLNLSSSLKKELVQRINTVRRDDIKVELNLMMEEEDENILECLSKLAIQFGINKVFRALKQALDPVQNIDEVPNYLIDNVGAYVRTLIRLDIEKNGSLV